MADPATERAEQTHAKIAKSAEAVRVSEAQQVDSAGRRTQLAADRTVLAAERTYAAWVRTGLAALAFAVGVRAVLDKVVPHWLIVPHVLASTDLLSVMPGRLAAALSTHGLTVRELPFESAPFDWTLYWHRRHEGNRAIRWLRELIAETFQAVHDG